MSAINHYIPQDCILLGCGSFFLFHKGREQFDFGLIVDSCKLLRPIHIMIDDCIDERGVFIHEG